MKPAIIPRNGTGPASLAQDANPGSILGTEPEPTKALAQKTCSAGSTPSQDLPDAVGDLREAQAAIDGMVTALAWLSPEGRRRALRRLEGALSLLQSTETAMSVGVFAVHVMAAEAGVELRPKQAAALLGVSVSTTRTWCSTGRLSSRRVGGRIRIAETAVAEFLAEGER